VESALKQRLVGAGVIIALGIIVIPMILDGAGERQLRKMPEAPKASTVSSSGFIIQNQQKIKLPAESAVVVPRLKEKPVSNSKTLVQSKPVSKKDIKTPRKISPKVDIKPKKKSVVKKSTSGTKSVAVSKKTAVPVPSQIKKKSASQLQSWVIQVGSFTDPKKALSLRKSLRKKRYKAFVEKVSGRSGQLYRVRIGPMVSRKLAENMSKKLKKDGIKSFITRHP